MVSRSRFIGSVLAGLAAAVPIFASAAIERERPGQESFLTSAIFADGRLWVLSDAGVLSSVAEGHGTRVRESLPDPVFALCLRGDHPAVITGTRGGTSAWTLRRRVNGTWSVEATIQTEADALVALVCTGESVTVLTTRRLVKIDNNKQSAVALSGNLNAGLTSSAYGTTDHLFVGTNLGEFGGSLHRIDRRSGTIKPIERNAAGELCGGPLNPSCDPVNGIAAVPWKPGCVAAAIGLIHLFSMHGRVVEVCGDQVERLYDKPYVSEALSAHGMKVEMTVAFFGLAREGDSLWALGIDGIYSIGQDGTAHFTPLPKFKEVGGIKVSFELPHFILVLTDINARLSTSGSVPMLVQR